MVRRGERMLIEFDCKKCRNHVREHALDGWRREPHPGVCLGCRAKKAPPPPPPLRNVRSDIRPSLQLKPSHRLELFLVPLAAMVAGFIGGALALNPQWWIP